jgi:4-amino-4-deoxy-L-arabinose transferase-like glycosyltransferase
MQTTPTDERVAVGWLALASVFEWADAAGRWIENHPRLMVGILSAVYFVLIGVTARRKMVWEDEFFTLFIAGTRDFAGIWEALLTGADQHPPSFYFLTHALFAAFGISHFTLRLPAIVGFGVMMVCLYKIVADRTSPLYGLAAMVLPVSTSTLYYATEGRGYGLVLGFSALATLCWLKAAEFPERSRYAAGLALCLAGAIGSHYYAILLLIPIAVGEFVRWVQTRRLRPTIVLACAAALLPVALFVPVIRSASGYSAHFWARPLSWTQPFYNLLGEFRSLATRLIVVLLVVGWVTYKLRWRKEPTSEGRKWWSTHEIAFFSVLLCLPLAAYLLAVFVTNGYDLRYAIAFAIGMAVMLMLGSYRVLGGTRAGGLALFAAMSGFALFSWYSSIRTIDVQRKDLRETAEYLLGRGNGAEMIMVGQVMGFHQLSFYAPRRLARRLVYPADTERAVQYLHHNTIDRCHLALRPWFPERIEPYEQVLKSYGTFHVFDEVGGWSWLSFALADDRIDTSYIGRFHNHLLLLAHTGAPAQRSGQDELLRDRAFDPTGQIVSGDEETLCAAWTNDKSCGFLAGIGEEQERE